MNNKIKGCILSLSLLTASNAAYAVGCVIPPTPPFAPIKLALVDPAIKANDVAIDAIGTTFNSAFMTKLLGNRQYVPTGMINVATPQTAVATSNTAHLSGFGALYVRHALIAEAEASRTQKVVSTMVESSELQKAKMIDVYRRLQSEEMDYLGTLANKETELSLSGAYSDENGNGGSVSEDLPSYQYFKTACERKKQTEVIVSAKTEKNRSSRVSRSVSSKSLNRVSGNSVSSAREAQIEHYEDYCTESNKDLGLCEKPSVLPNGDVNSNIALNPRFVADPEKNQEQVDIANNIPEEMQLTSTYSNDEYEAAKDFAENVIGYFKVTQPTPVEISDVGKAKFVQKFRGSAARLSVAEYSAMNAVEKRKEIVQYDGKIPMSEMEIKKKLVEEMYNSDSNTNLLGANKLGVDIQEYLALNVKTKLEFDRYEHLSRIELLMASYLAQKENGASKYNFLESLKNRGDGGI